MIDLHIHSNASDGVYPPGEVVRRAAAAGLSTVGLTDHDTLAGVGEATRAGGELGVRVVPGCEFSVASDWGELHLLAYFLPVDSDGELESFLAGQRAHRLARAEETVRRLRRAGLNVGIDDVMEQAGRAAVGRPHVARAIVARHAVSDISAAFAQYLGKGRPAFVPKQLPSVGDVTALVRRCGGVTSVAHLKEQATQGNLTRLRGQGVDGVEVHHPSHDAERAAAIQGLAFRLGLLPTGGSDWHGDDELRGDRGALGAVTIPDTWVQALERLHGERRATREVAWDRS